MTHSHEQSDLQTLVRDEIDAWHAGQKPDASRLLAERPELRKAKSLVLDLALAEYALRTAAGDKIAKNDFCERFPAYRQSIAKLLSVQEFLDQCPQFAVHDSTRWPLPGDGFLGFEIVEPMGRGGMARVFLARQPELGNRQVVIKVSRFASREAHTLGKLSHPSIMPVFSVTRDDEADWTVICMPLLGAATGVDVLDAAFVTGTTRNAELIRRIASATCPLAVSAAVASEQFDWDLTYPSAIARVGLQLAEALAVAHAAGILHRDIKPSNVLFAWSGRPILLDFNLSSDAAAMVQGVGGTLAYMAPELIASVLNDRGQTARNFDPRYDIYSLGAVLYELLSGRLPAKPANAEELPIDAYEPWLHCKRDAVAPLAWDIEEADEDLERIVLKCLSFEPAERFATADELVAALRHNLNRRTTKPLTESPPITAPPLPASGRGRRAVLAAAVGVIGGALGFAAYHSTRGTPLERIYQKAIDEYNAGNYENAVAAFTQCLEQKPGWPDALFGRGQSFLKLEKWHEARTDFTALRATNPMWANTLAAYCNVRSGDDSFAHVDFISAYNMGQRNVLFLLNYARVLTRLQRLANAERVYSEVLSLEPNNRVALSNRALLGVARVRNDKTARPSAQTLEDAAHYYELERDTPKGAFCAAIVFGEAARKDSTYRQRAVDYLTEALGKGMPLETASQYQIQMKPLVALVEDSVLKNAKHDPSSRVSFTPVQDYSDTPSWQLFLEKSATPSRRALAHGS